MSKLCNGLYHLSCTHATAEKLIEVIESAETSPFQDGKIAVVGVRADHWRAFVLQTDKADSLLKVGTFSVTRANGDIIFVVPVEDLPFPKVLTDAEQSELVRVKKKESKSADRRTNRRVTQRKNWIP